MNFKTQNSKLIGQLKNVNVAFDMPFTVGDLQIEGPGEYESNNILVVSPEPNIFSLMAGGLHIVYWRAHNGKLKVESDALGNIDVMVLDLDKEKTTLKDVVAAINELSPCAIVLAKPDLRDELSKEITVTGERHESWKAEAGGEEDGQRLILLPCSQN